MSKRFGLCISYIVTGIVILYLAYDASLNGDTLENFLIGYLESPQKYLFLMTILITPILLCRCIPYFDANIKVRMKNNIFFHILKRGICISFYSAIAIWGIFSGSGIVWKLEGSVSIICLLCFVKLLIFIFCMYINSNVFYFVTGKQIFSVLLTAVVNFLLIMFIYSFCFYVMNNTMDEFVFDIIYEIYISCCMAGGVLYLFLNAEKEICISQEK